MADVLCLNLGLVVTLHTLGSKVVQAESRLKGDLDGVQVGLQRRSLVWV